MTETRKIPPGHKQALDMIREAAERDQLGLMSCKDKATGEDVTILFIGWWTENDQDGRQFNSYPVAALFNQDPVDIYDPPGGAEITEF